MTDPHRFVLQVAAALRALSAELRHRAWVQRAVARDVLATGHRLQREIGPLRLARTFRGGSGDPAFPGERDAPAEPYPDEDHFDEDHFDEDHFDEDHFEETPEFWCSGCGSLDVERIGLEHSINFGPIRALHRCQLCGVAFVFIRPRPR